MLVFADFLVVDVFDEDGSWWWDLVEVGYLWGLLCRDDLDVQAGFFFYFSYDGLDWVFIGFDVSAGW